jgi:hypothetical protein
MSSAKTLFGFHAIGVRIKTAPASILEIHIEPTRRDARMRQFVERIKEAGIRLIESDGMRLAKLCGSPTNCWNGWKPAKRICHWHNAYSRCCWCSMA